MDAIKSQVARSRFLTAVTKILECNIFTFCSLQRKNTSKSGLWKPRGLRAPVLIFTIAICWSLIAVLQVFLIRSQRDQGIIFAPRINDLPLRKTFMYLYFPTVIAVLFSVYWTWIDLETKRMEPYYQLSKESGALGKDSLLLQYPFDFIPFVPFKAARDRHWPVFWASTAVIFVTWGLVPTQAGIFSTKTVTRVLELPFSRSTAFIPVSEQTSKLDVGFTQSTYAIATLNETLGQYMARNYTLAPFRPTSQNTSAAFTAHGNWSVPTTMYSVELDCAPATVTKSPMGRGIVANSTDGCSFQYGLDGNLTQGPGADKSEVLRIKQFTAMYTGYWNPFGFADYSLDVACPSTSNHTFYAAMQRNKVKATDPVQSFASIFCSPRYFQQEVVAAIDAATLIPHGVELIGNRTSLDSNLLNTTMFEELLSSGSIGNEVKSDMLPIKSAPDYLDFLGRTNLSLSSTKGVGLIQPMAGLALAMSNRPLEDHLDWQVLAKSYADAYKLIFSRAMRDILDQKFSTTNVTSGHSRARTEAVVLEPVFVYIVEGLLGVISIATIALLYLSVTREKHLRSNPGTIAAVMSMVADNPGLLSDMGGLGCCAMDEIKKHVGNQRYKLIDDGAGPLIIELSTGSTTADDSTVADSASQHQTTVTEITKPVRPNEFSLWVAFPLVSLFMVLAFGLTVMFIKARARGLPLASSNTVVQNVLENYVPTALATLIEPMWVLINRLLCMLQPIEELRSCKARAQNSIDADYSSLPPQLVIFKSLRTRHFVLSAVCMMALLANLLAIAFSGLFNQVTIEMRHRVTLAPPFDPKFVPIQGSIGPTGGSNFGSLEPSGAYLGGNGEAQFLVADSYLKQGIPLPAWTDEAMFYLPLFLKGENDTVSAQLEGRTQAFGAKLECTSIEYSGDFKVGLLWKTEQHTSLYPSMNMTVTSDTGAKVRCTTAASYIQNGPVRSGGSCVSGPSATELVFVPGAAGNTTQANEDTCMGSVVLGWLRDPNGSCVKGKAGMLTKQNATFVHCRPRLRTGFANIKVDANGRLQKKAENVTINDIGGAQDGNLFSNNAVNLIGQSNRYIFKSDSPQWHNDSFAVDFINYFAARVSNTTRLLNPGQGLPDFKDIEEPLNKAYALLFAIWLSTNRDSLLVPSKKRNSPSLLGWRIQSEKRLFLSTPMYAISMGILCVYIIVAIVVYIRRPGRYLARLPTSIASLIALFAASAAVQDMRGTSHLDKKGRARHLKEIDARYGYGSFVGGSDGRVYIGIDKSPFVRMRPECTWWEKKMKSFRTSSKK